MATFPLRPAMSPSPSPTASTSTPDDQNPSYKTSSTVRSSPPGNPNVNGRARRPLSPNFLRDVDLTNSNDGQPRKYPAPPTGHDLMAMFPPAPPDNFPELRAGPTSGYFVRQERAFFAQAGKEIVRVRVEVDLPPGSGNSRQWQPPSAPSGPASASQSPHISSSSAPVPYPHHANRPLQRHSLPNNVVPLFPLSTNHPHSHPGLPSNLHAHQNGPDSRTPPRDASFNAKGDYSPEDPDEEAWRRPTPQAERRRAGKHTKRVIVRT
ncbi:hypothetical protein CC1G_01611 [Coprinopsis cinerea okayama7|uniref:Uncharacterized protein n=1 Tax=Coprinopsis cinerea (strain Okayama-7 / 130 / ATCC MYA-4618 / FGSC 9003) TaxID=240176 RepID=A8NI85_COPC7|nr:hypothetical protein CC1G_01611 [Coprinopsis cinerea okayama7\|eukprot:XP_001833934.1 hypothetical protein CC1G_01611 [Coprinopsis cinerea okayama7\